MKRVLLDTNVVIDVLLSREPHLRASAEVWAAVETRRAEGLLAAHAVTTIHYLVSMGRGHRAAKRVVAPVLSVFDVAPVDQTVVLEAFRLSLDDFEDAVTAAAAHAASCDFIVTRDSRGFRGSPVRALAPEAVLPLLV